MAATCPASAGTAARMTGSDSGNIDQKHATLVHFPRHSRVLLSNRRRANVTVAGVDHPDLVGLLYRSRILPGQAEGPPGRRTMADRPPQPYRPGRTGLRSAAREAADAPRGAARGRGFDPAPLGGTLRDRQLGLALGTQGNDDGPGAITPGPSP